MADWTRRDFLTASTAAALSSHAWPPLFAQLRSHSPRSAARSPEEITGGIRPLFENQTARPLRYTPEQGDFVIRNGIEFFNRPLYGPNNAFRADAGDLPEFSLYLPGHGGNLRLGMETPGGSKWLFQAAEVVARYRPGRMLYEVRDPFLDGGSLHLELFTQGEGSGILLRVEAHNPPRSLSLSWAFGGVSGRKGKRGGDIGCESEPVSAFFQVRPEECTGNDYKIEGPIARVHSKAADLLLRFPPESSLAVADAHNWGSWAALKLSADQSTNLPVLIGSVALSRSAPLYMAIDRITSAHPAPSSVALPVAFTTRQQELTSLAATLRVETPDPFVNAAAGALAIAADAIWDAAIGAVMHGAVAWRVPLAGWRGPYAMDDLGWHSRMEAHLRHWFGRQNVSSEEPTTGPADPGTHLTRKEHLLHSRGDLSHNHYDMNLVCFDAFLRHLRWTGDLDFARESWPALMRHLDWERRLFRRTYTDAAGQSLPLYEGYACIWASDNLQYNGGGTAHASAYNYFANRFTARIARLLGDDPAPFEEEAALILKGMQKLLWLPEQGIFAESKDLLGPQTAYTSPALWSVYHAIDSEVPTPRQAWQMAAERLAILRHVPIHGSDVPAGNWYLLSCSDWFPYIWSLNLLVLAENMHTALALWQAGMAEEAFLLFKGNLLDSMFQGLCPGNLHMSSQLDVHRQEAQRDFGDPIGMTSRALVEGLFGIQPDLLRGTLTLRPGFPAAWDHASLQHPDLSIDWRREGARDRFHMIPNFAKPIALSLVLRARGTHVPTVICNGTPVHAHFDSEAVGSPVLSVNIPAAASWNVEIHWSGQAPAPHMAPRVYTLGESLQLPTGAKIIGMDDPQHCLRDGHVAISGAHTVFARLHQGDCQWWMPVSFEARTTETAEAKSSRAITGKLKTEPLDLAATLRHQISDVFRRSYAAPRSQYCSLAIPEQGIGGWAAFDLQPTIDDSGLRAANGILHTPVGVPFRTPSDPKSPNCLFLSQWQQDVSRIRIPLSGNARQIYLLLAGTTLPQASHMTHAIITVRYGDGASTELPLRNPENWWPIEQDYLIDDYQFFRPGPIPPRVDLRTGETRILEPASFRGKGRNVPGGSATIIDLPLDGTKPLASLELQVVLYGVVVGLLAATLVRS